jgi:hypothetical protein
MYIAKLKDGPKRVKKIFSMILEMAFEMVWWRGRDEITSNRIFEIEVPFSSENVNFPFIWRDFWSFSFFSLLFFSSVSWGLRGFDDNWGENHFFKNFFSNSFNILAVDAYSELELCRPTWLNHDYGDGELQIYWRWTHILE